MDHRCHRSNRHLFRWISEYSYQIVVVRENAFTLTPFNTWWTPSLRNFELPRIPSAYRTGVSEGSPILINPSEANHLIFGSLFSNPFMKIGMESEWAISVNVCIDSQSIHRWSEYYKPARNRITDLPISANLCLASCLPLTLSPKRIPRRFPISFSTTHLLVIAYSLLLLNENIS